MSPATQSARINFRTDVQTKAAAEELFQALGLDLSTALNMFLKQAIREQALPIQPSLSVGNAATAKALDHTRRIVDGEIADDGVAFNSASDAIKFLNELA